MKKVEISYDPYRMKTKMSINGFDVCANKDHDKIKKFIEAGVPLQTWIEPVEYQGWKGLVNEISHPEDNDEVTLVFSGREIDFQDLKRSIETQNSRRAEDKRVEYHFQQTESSSDRDIARRIDEVVGEMKSDWFRDLVSQRSEGTEVREYYDRLEESYALAKGEVFPVVFAGAYSSGKSTLLNALMRHNILPTQQGTCTSRNCRIRHDSSLGSQVSLACFDAQDKLIGQKQIFSSDADCCAAFKEKTEQPGAVTMELGVDLSHLYPDSVNMDKFIIVLIDTPGMDSAKSSKDGVNRHAQIALDAISMRNKPMIILCADANYTDNKSIGEFMREILERSPEDYQGFTDRFLFLLNKGDTIEYANGHTSEDVKRAFAEYLTDSSKWDIKGDEKELRDLAERASHFVPRVFITAAGVETAIQQGAPDHTDEDCTDEEKQILADRYEVFEKQVWRRKKEYYYLSRYCDIPSYRRDELEKAFQEARESGDEVRAVHIQCGILPVEIAIRDYIERYAYPIKVHDLLDTFEDILTDVKSFSKGAYDELMHLKDRLGEADRDLKEANDGKDIAEDNQRTLEQAQEEIEKRLGELRGITFDAEKLGDIVSDLRYDIENDQTVRYVRKYRRKADAGKKPEKEIEKEIQRKIEGVQKAFDSALEKANSALEEILEKHEGQLRDIYNSIEKTMEDLKIKGLLSGAGYDFTESVTWKRSFESINFNDYKAEILSSVVNARTQRLRKANEKKLEYMSSGNVLKIVASFFMPKTVLETVPEDGFYKPEALVRHIDKCYQDFNAQTNEMETVFNVTLESAKERAEELLNELSCQIALYHQDVKRRMDTVSELGSDRDRLSSECRKAKETFERLEELQKRLQEV